MRSQAGAWEQGNPANYFATQSTPEKSFVATSPRHGRCDKLKKSLRVNRPHLGTLRLGRNSGASGDIELTRSRKLFPSAPFETLSPPTGSGASASLFAGAGRSRRRRHRNCVIAPPTESCRWQSEKLDRPDAPSRIGCRVCQIESVRLTALHLTVHSDRRRSATVSRHKARRLAQRGNRKCRASCQLALV